ncbi:MAG: hypothetical protein LBG43_11100 [Treponema sp.]|jgi:hypothetical protein|nr:hypothetical protein [Treponema sp.]
MDKDTVKRIEALEQRVGALEKASTRTDKPDRNIVELDLTLPEADIGGLRFNKQKVHAVFHKKDDGWWHSRDILFLSARNVEDDNSRDILTEYLNSYEFRERIRLSLPGEVFGEVLNPDDIEVSLPKKAEEVKSYNGVNWWYWLADPPAGFAASFCYVFSGGYANGRYASTVGGCAPLSVSRSGAANPGCRHLAGGLDRGGRLRRKRGRDGLCDQHRRKVSSGRLREPAEVEAGCKPWTSRESRI